MQKEIPIPKTLLLPESDLTSDSCKLTEDVDKKCKKRRSISPLPPLKPGEAMQKEIPVLKTQLLPEDNLASDSCKLTEDVDKKCKTSRSIRPLPPLKPGDGGQCKPHTITKLKRFLQPRANMVTEKATKSFFYEEQTCLPKFEDLLDWIWITTERSVISNNWNDMANQEINANHTTTRVAKRPSSVSYEVKSIAADEKETRVIFIDNNRTLFKAILTDSGSTTQSVSGPLLQKCATLDPNFDVPKCSWKLHQSQHSIKKELAKTLKISAQYIYNVCVEQNKLFKIAQDRTEDQTSNNSSIRSQSPIVLDLSTTSSPMNQNIPPSPSRINTTPTLELDTTATKTSNVTAPSSDSVTSILATRISSAITLLPSSASEILPRCSTQETLKVTSLLPGSVRFTSTPSSLTEATTLTTSAFSFVSIRAWPSTTCKTTSVCNTPRVTPQHTSFSPSQPLQSVVSSVCPVTQIVPDRPSSTAAMLASPTQCTHVLGNSKPQSPVNCIPTTSYSLSKTRLLPNDDQCNEDKQLSLNCPTLIPQDLARKLLMVGAMPILPPGRRQWENVPDESIVLTPTLRWPPKKWQTFSPDQRALAVEFAANTIEQQDGYHLIDRNYLIFKYNYLVLPGTACNKYTLDINYEVIRSIAANESSYNLDMQHQIVSSFKPSESTQLLSDILHIPLRLAA